MCLAVPARIKSIEHANSLMAQGLVDFGAGVCKIINLSFVPDVQIGDDVLVHAGVAIQKLHPDDAEARRSLFEAISRDLDGHVE